MKYHALLEYIKSKHIKGKNNYLSIDEVQLCEGFEKVINSFHVSEKYDIYISGSKFYLMNGGWWSAMRLQSINVYSSYLGDTERTRERTCVLRKDADFLDYEFVTKIKYCNNEILKQLNISCSEEIDEMYFDKTGLSLGYPEVIIPFNILEYEKLTKKKKEEFWILEIEKILDFLYPIMKYDTDRMNEYISHLKKVYIQE